MPRWAWLLTLAVGFGCAPQQLPPAAESGSPVAEAQGLDGRTLFRRPLSPELQAEFSAKLESAELALAEGPDDEMNWVWLGRRTAYLGRFRDAIAIYSRALERFPDSYRLRRHRGHRYLTLRRFAEARDDLAAAARLADAHPNRLEPDGMPNPAGIPVSSTHGNIHYHLGLAHFWLGELEAAERAFVRAAGFARNDDAICSSHYWLYLMRMRLGRLAEALQALEPITAEMTILENHAYHRLLLLYRGELTPEQLGGTSGSGGSSEAELYGLSIRHLLRDEPLAARELWLQLADGERWDAFGAIAAEVELARIDRP